MAPCDEAGMLPVCESVKRNRSEQCQAGRRQSVAKANTIYKVGSVKSRAAGSSESTAWRSESARSNISLKSARRSGGAAAAATSAAAGRRPREMTRPRRGRPAATPASKPAHCGILRALDISHFRDLVHQFTGRCCTFNSLSSSAPPPAPNSRDMQYIAAALPPRHNLISEYGQPSCTHQLRRISTNTHNNSAGLSLQACTASCTAAAPLLHEEYPSLIPAACMFIGQWEAMNKSLALFHLRLHHVLRRNKGPDQSYAPSLTLGTGSCSIKLEHLIDPLHPSSATPFHNHVPINRSLHDDNLLSTARDQAQLQAATSKALDSSFNDSKEIESSACTN